MKSYGITMVTKQNILRSLTRIRHCLMHQCEALVAVIHHALFATHGPSAVVLLCLPDESASAPTCQQKVSFPSYFSFYFARFHAITMIILDSLL